MCSCNQAMLRRLETFLECLYLKFSCLDKFVHVELPIAEGLVRGLVADCADIDYFCSLLSTGVVCWRLLAFVLGLSIRGWTVWWHDKIIVHTEYLGVGTSRFNNTWSGDRVRELYK